MRVLWIALLLVGLGGAQQDPDAPDLPAMQRLWSVIKAHLSAPDGERYFEENVLDSELPYLYGVVLSSSPKERPEVLELAMFGKSPEVTLRISSGLKEPVGNGAEVIFQGVAEDFSKEPFRLTIVTKKPVRIHEPPH